jgi:acyl carrier protein
MMAIRSSEQCILRESVLAQLRVELNDVLSFIQHSNANQWISEDLHLSDDLGLDSLDIMDFIARTELFYKREIGDDNVERLYSLNLIADFICESTL